MKKFHVHVVNFANQRKTFKNPSQNMMDYLTFSLMRMSWFPVVITLLEVSEEDYNAAAD